MLFAAIQHLDRVKPRYPPYREPRVDDRDCYGNEQNAGNHDPREFQRRAKELPAYDAGQ